MIDWLGVDAITVHPYLGSEALQPFLDRADKGIIVLCRTSNSGAKELQDRLVLLNENDAESAFFAQEAFSTVTHDCTLSVPGSFGKEESFRLAIPFYQHVAWEVANGGWNANGNCCIVVGATYPGEMAIVRKIAPNMPFLIPGVGFQQKGVPLAVQVQQIVVNGQDANGQGMIINNSRAILFASKAVDFATQARAKLEEMDREIRQALLKTA